MAETERFHSLDALRAGALLLGIAAALDAVILAGLPRSELAHHRRFEQPGLGGLFFVVHIFRMSVFYADRRLLRAPAAGERWEPGGFVRNRLRRIALPLRRSYVMVMPLLIAPFIWAMK